VGRNIIQSARHSTLAEVAGHGQTIAVPGYPRGGRARSGSLNNVKRGRWLGIYGPPAREKCMIYRRWIISLLILIVSGGDDQPVHYSHTTMSTTKKWVVTLSNEKSVRELSRKLTETGFDVDQVLDQIGCITGSGSDEVAQKIRKISGVADVSPESTIQLPPSDESVTW